MHMDIAYGRKDGHGLRPECTVASRMVPLEYLLMMGRSIDFGSCHCQTENNLQCAYL